MAAFKPHHRIRTFGLLSTCGSVALVASPAQAAEALPQERAALVAEALRLRAEVGGAVWPGFELIQTPIVLLDGDREWLIGFPAPVEGFEALQTSAPLDAPVQVGPRTIEGNLAASFPAHAVPAVVISTPEALGWTPSQWVLTAAHEMFHVMQMQRGEWRKVGRLAIVQQDDDGAWMLSFPFPYEDATARTLLHQQAWPCYIGAEALDEAEARYAAGVAAGASTALRAWLETTNAPAKSAEYAAFQQWKEGVAKWVEREMARRAADSTPLPEFAALPAAGSYSELWTGTYEGQRFLAKHAGRASASRTVFYHLGMAKAALLERLDPTWKTVYFDDDVWLDALLSRVAAGQSCAQPAAPTGD